MIMDELPFWAEIGLCLALIALLDWAIRPERWRHWLGIVLFWVGIVSLLQYWGVLCALLGWNLWYHSDRYRSG